MKVMAKEKPVKQTVKNGRGRKPGRASGGRFAPGNAGGPGRPAGTPNSFSAQIKADLLEAYYKRGGKKYLVRLPDTLFVRLLATGLPRESPTSAEPDAPAPEVNVQVLERIIGLLDAAAAAADVRLPVDPDLRRLLVGRDAAGAGE